VSKKYKEEKQLPVYLKKKVVIVTTNYRAELSLIPARVVGQ